MKNNLLLKGLHFLFLLTLPFFCVLCRAPTTGSVLENSISVPDSFQESQLVGVWEASYGTQGGEDLLVLEEDGTFRQFYESSDADFSYEITGNEWWVETLPDGRLQVHLEGARYYRNGISLGDRTAVEGHVFYDPFARQNGFDNFVEMQGELLLNIRLLQSGEIVLAHLWASASEDPNSDRIFHHVPPLIHPPESALENSVSVPGSFQESQLVGVWEASYGTQGGEDLLVLEEDGTFRQFYESSDADFSYEITGNEWRVETLPDGRLQVHLEGARYYRRGPSLGDRTAAEGRVFFDPFADRGEFDNVEMQGELLLNIRLLPSGEIILAHLWTSASADDFNSDQILHHVSPLIHSKQ